MASSSSSSGGISNMSRLLASSRLSSYHPKISQVYTAPPSHISRGDFGVKRPLPTSHLNPGAVRYVELGKQDTKEGQTEWREREREVVFLKRFSELNVQVAPKASGDLIKSLDSHVDDVEGVTMASLGPRISTTYDPSTRRVVPTHYNGIPNEEVKTYLQSEARLGRGPLYMDSLQGEADGGPYGRASQGYTSYPVSRTNYRNMSEKQFQKFLHEIRSNREAFKDHLGARAAKMARLKTLSQYKKQRDLIALEAQRAEEIGATKVEVPAPISEKDLPLPVRSDQIDGKGIPVDLWNEVRTPWDAPQSLWVPWLQGQNSIKVRSGTSQLLPLISNPKGGEEIPTAQHIVGGLQYGQPDQISTQLLNDSLPARVIGKGLRATSAGRTINKSAGLSGQSVAVAGRIAFMPYSVSENARSIDPSQLDPAAGNIRVKVYKALREVKRESEGDDLTFKRFAPDNSDRLPAAYGITGLAVRSTESSERSSLAKGLPGSSEWIGRLNGDLGYQTGQGDDAMLDIVDPNAMSSPRPKRSNLFRLAVDSESSRLTPDDRLRRAKKRRLSATTSSNKRHSDIFTRLMTKEKEKERQESEKQNGGSRLSGKS